MEKGATESNLISFTSNDDTLIHTLSNGSSEEILSSLRTIRTKVAPASSGGMPPEEYCNLLVQRDIIKILIHLIQSPEFSCSHKEESAWIISNIASVISLSPHNLKECAQPLVTAMTKTKSLPLLNQFAWCLGNLAIENNSSRNFILSANILPVLQKIIQKGQGLKRSQIVWCFSNLCRKGNLPNIQDFLVFLPALLEIMRRNKDSSDCTSAAWALSYLAEYEEIRHEFIRANLVVPYVHFTGNKNRVKSLTVPCWRFFGSVVQDSSEAHIQIYVQEGILEHINSELVQGDDELQKELCWCLSNMTAESASLATAILNSALFNTVISLIETGSEKLKTEAAWVIGNTTTKPAADLSKLWDSATLKRIVPLITMYIEASPVIAEAFQNLFEIGAKKQTNEDLFNPFLLPFANAGGIEAILEVDNAEKIETNRLSENQKSLFKQKANNLREQCSPWIEHHKQRKKSARICE